MSLTYGYFHGYDYYVCGRENVGVFCDLWIFGSIFKYLKLSNRERNVLFNDALNTFYLRLYGVRHMVKGHSDSEKGNPLPPHRLLLSINSKCSLFMHHPTDRITHTTAFVTPVVENYQTLSVVINPQSIPWSHF